MEKKVLNNQIVHKLFKFNTSYTIDYVSYTDKMNEMNEMNAGI